MIKKQTIIILLTAVASIFSVDATPLFRTRCLERLAKAMKMEFPTNLGMNIDNDSTWNFKGKALRVRTNHYGDISHIGYKLFDSEWARQYKAQPLLDFIERYALEQDVQIEGVDKAEESSRKNVTFTHGKASLLKNCSPEKTLTIEEKERRSYRIAWGEENDEQKVRMTVPADYQVFTGANAIELEAIFERDLKRTSSSLFSNRLPENWKDGDYSYSDQYCIVGYGAYLSDEIRSDIYLRKQEIRKEEFFLENSDSDFYKSIRDYAIYLNNQLRIILNSNEMQGKEDSLQQYTILWDEGMPLRSVTNLLLTGSADWEIPMELTIDKYGYSNVKVETTLQQLLRYFFQEGCRPYLGIKTHDSKMITATLFALNVNMGYNHMVSFEVPLSILREKQGIIKGRVYLYIPLQNITEKFFTNDIKQDKP